MIREPPKSIVEGGRIHIGAFRSPIRKMNFSEADIFSGPIMGRFWKFRLKEWVGFGFTHPKWYASMIIQDAKYLASSAFYLYNRETKKYIEGGLVKPSCSVRLATSHWNDYSKISGKGYYLEFIHNLDNGRHKISMEVAAAGKSPAIMADLILDEDLTCIQPLVVSLPVEPKHYMYTHKVPLAVEGAIHVGNETIEFDPSRDTANLDEHKAFYPYHTKWRWATFTNRDDKGRIIGVNLADHMFQDQERNNENCIWIDDKLVLLGCVNFDFDPHNPNNPWKIWDNAGYVELEFFPDGRKQEKHNFLLVGMDYYQVFGCFRGRITDSDGERHPVVDYYGVTEKMDARF